MELAGIVTVCTGPLLPELREFLPSARVAFPETPIHVYTDEPDHVTRLVAEYRIAGVTSYPCGDHRLDLSRVLRIDDHWDPSAIAWKLLALKQRVEALDGAPGGILLADCDITFRTGFERVHYGDVALSPFYWGKRDIFVPSPSHPEPVPLQIRDGEYNAGLLMTRSLKFCNWWLETYLSGEGGFYEQKCLDLVPGLFHCDYFSPLHNWGKWRFASPHPAVRSYHQHLAERARIADVGAIKIAAQRAGAEARAKLRNAP